MERGEGERRGVEIHTEVSGTYSKMIEWGGGRGGHRGNRSDPVLTTVTMGG